jgi:hypothetical protein
MSKESQALLSAFHSIIEHNSNNLYELLVNHKSRNPLLNLTEAEIEELNTISLNSQQMNVVYKGVIAMGEGIVFELLCIIDGVADVENTIPDLAIVDRETKNEIVNRFWHDEFIASLKD